MKTKTTRSELPYKEKATGLDSAKFHDGMVVSAEDLETASQYPVSLLQSVLRSYFGCGVVCGLGLNPVTKLKGEPPWVVRVDRGLAVDCHGFPIELTCPVDLDFDPDPCSPDDLPSPVFIALRRTTSDEDASQPCGCSSDEADESCTRVRDRALVKAFTREQLESLSGGVCGRLEELDTVFKESADTSDKAQPRGAAAVEQATADTDWCSVLQECSCSCNSDWVLLGAVNLKQRVNGTEGDSPQGIVGINADVRRWVKPVDVLCDVARSAGQVSGLVQRIDQLEAKVAQLQNPDPR
ncbi:hypothetical protein [Kocuria rosea]|uniref:Uncharacterized protein n=1 Tax=Kocuria rosea subsp. polaris TaxID=136273 RepID=A0A0A6VNL6_KOCRO|nr:hypothetical protein [Kocuria polaris]KHD96660.1 hypothetical protein GY22_14495 [Kocuria polaris]